MKQPLLFAPTVDKVANHYPLWRYQKWVMKSGKSGDSAAREKTKQTRTTEADVIQFSGCKDEQTSADAMIGGQATGAMSYALITCLQKNKTLLQYMPCINRLYC